MARIPKREVERLKTEVAVVRLIEAAGIALKKHGGKDLIGRCPFHDDKTPSLVVTPDKNLWHCLGACGTGGGPIDWVMRWHKVSFRHASELLLRDYPGLAASTDPEAAKPPSAAQVRRAAQTFYLDAGDQALLDQVVGFYHETLKQSPEALAYLESRGLRDPALIERYQLGYANRTLAYRLAPKQVKAGAEIRTALQRLGVLRPSGHEHLNGSLVIPVFGASGEVQQLYGRKIRADLRPGTPSHLYLPGPHRGVFNRANLDGASEIILCEALIDALTFLQAGFLNVTTSYGVNGFTEELMAALKNSGARRILIAYDRDEAGNVAAGQLAQRLQAEGLASYRLNFPKGMDANAYACEVKPAKKALGVVIRSAEWLGQGEAPARDVPPPTMPAPVAVESTSTLAAEPIQTESPPDAVAPAEDAACDALTDLPAQAVPAAAAAEVEADVDEREVVVNLGPRRYRVRGLAKNTSFEVLKVNILVASGEALHVDTFDLYSAKHRQVYARAAAAELGVEDNVIQRELGQLLLKLESLQTDAIEAALKPKLPAEVALNPAEREAALALLRDPQLMDRIAADIEAAGLIGEPVNAQVAYLAAVSRKLAEPLAILIQSTSAAGKSALMDAVLAFMPEEDRIHYSAMTGQSLFYLGERDLKHKILAIAEEEGVRQASYALKLLQSQGELTIASTGKDPATGKLVTEEYRVEGPVMLTLTTTAIDVDEELLNRCLVLAIDESRAQTRRIQARQREKRTLAGLMQTQQAEALQALHQNAQRLLRPLAVVNPYADQLTFLDERTRTRRDHQKYLTLIDAIALLHQHQREIKSFTHQARTIEYLEVTREDIALANRLAHAVLGRSLDELPPQTRRVLGIIAQHVDECMRTDKLLRAEVRFTRRDIRERAGLSNAQVALHLDRLVAYEYLVTHGGKNGQRFIYELIYDGDSEDREPRLPGLIDADTLTTAADLPDSGKHLPGRFRSASGALPATCRDDEKPAAPKNDGQLDAFADVPPKNAAHGQDMIRHSHSPFLSSSLVAKAS